MDFASAHAGYPATSDQDCHNRYSVVIVRYDGFLTRIFLDVFREIRPIRPGLLERMCKFGNRCYPQSFHTSGTWYSRESYRRLLPSSLAQQHAMYLKYSGLWFLLQRTMSYRVTGSWNALDDHVRRQACSRALVIGQHSRHSATCTYTCWTAIAFTEPSKAR